MTKYDCAKFHVKSRFLSGFRQKGEGGSWALCAPPRGMIRQKYPGAVRVKLVTLFVNYFRYSPIYDIKTIRYNRYCQSIYCFYAVCRVEFFLQDCSYSPVTHFSYFSYMLNSVTPISAKVFVHFFLFKIFNHCISIKIY